MAALSPRRAAREAFDLFCTPQRRARSEAGEPFRSAELLQFDFQGYHIIGYRWNKGGRAKALIIHGFESTVANFGAYVNPLVAKGYEVLAFDAPAHGRSSGTRINALIYRDLIKYIHEHFGPVQSFLAHSLGGLALGIALAEMPGNEACKVVLVAPVTKMSTAVDDFFRFIRLRNMNAGKEFEKIVVGISGHSIAWFSLVRALEGVRARILWIHDIDDTITPVKDAEEIQNKAYANIKFVLTKNLGHRKIYRDPEIGRTIVDNM